MQDRMRNPFSRKRYVDKLRPQIGSQFATIMFLDTLLKRYGVPEAGKVEIVVFTQWLAMIGISQSQAMDDRQQASECITFLNDERRRLFAGLENGVKGSGGEVMVYPNWIQSADRALASFDELWNLRIQRYNSLLTNKAADARFSKDALGSVVVQAIEFVLNSALTEDHDTLVPIFRVTAQDSINHMVRILNS